MLRILVWITRKIAKGCGAFMGQSERLDAGKTPFPRLSPHAVDRGGHHPGGWGQGRGLAPSPHKEAMPGARRQTGAVSMGNVS
jgi:hypothetical protein